jgi:hypothetical protein
MSLYLKRLSLTNVRLEILTREDTDLQAQFLELMELREQVRTARFRRIDKTWSGLSSPRQLVSPQPPSMCCQPLPVTFSE